VGSGRQGDRSASRVLTTRQLPDQVSHLDRTRGTAGAPRPPPPAGSEAPPRPARRGPCGRRDRTCWTGVCTGCVRAVRVQPCRDKGLSGPASGTTRRMPTSNVVRQPPVHLPDDWIFIPSPVQVESGSTDQPTFLRQANWRSCVCGQGWLRARANLPYRLTIEPSTYEGTTDADGRIQSRFRKCPERAVAHRTDVDDYISSWGRSTQITEVSGIMLG
jgi:hypothetical protein